jgi:transcription termination/antitermination protein NusG
VSETPSTVEATELAEPTLDSSVEPAAEPVAVEDPVEAPSADATETPDSATDEAVTEEPTAEEPTAEEPTADEPTADEPVEDPVAEMREALRRAPGEWYVVHSYAGYENRVKTNLETRTGSLNMEDFIFQVEVPQREETVI